jgi:hypothetical protein
VPKDKVSSSYKLRRKSIEFPGGHQKVLRRMQESREPSRFEPRKSSEELALSHAEFLQGVQKEAEKVQVSDNEKSAKCAQGVRTCRSPKARRITHRQEEDRW